jgi:hypothetical protein
MDSSLAQSNVVVQFSSPISTSKDHLYMSDCFDLVIILDKVIHVSCTLTKFMC